MQPTSIAQLLVLVCCVPNAFAQWFDSLLSCNVDEENCKWFCDEDLPMVNRTTSGAFQTEFLSSILHQTNNLRDHSLFKIPGVHHHCLELSVQCSAARKTGSRNRSRVLLLNIHCNHFAVSYEVRFAASYQCYEVTVQHMAHQLWKPMTKCKWPNYRKHQIQGDGHQYLLLSQCLKEIMGQKPNKVAYWLFVNKRNTPQQNWKIMQQLSLPEELIMNAYKESDNASDRRSCRCDIFERYMRAYKQCVRPFNVLGLDNPGTGKAKPQARDKLDLTVLGDPAPSLKMQLFIVLWLFVAANVGVLLCAVYLHFRSFVEELL